MQSYAYIYKRILVTSKARYEASRRLKLHNWCSQWTLAFLAVGQIIISLLVTFKLTDKSIPTNKIEMANLFFAVVVLAYSLLLGMGDFSARASNIHQCGLQLAELARKLNYKVTQSMQSTENDYLNFVHQYYSCLNRHENHTSRDYLIAHLDYLRETQPDSAIKYEKWKKIKISAHCIAQFSHYIFSCVLILAWGLYLIGAI